MSSMSSAQIVSAASAMHSKSAGLNLGLTHNPVSYPGAVSFATASFVSDHAANILKAKALWVLLTRLLAFFIHLYSLIHQTIETTTSCVDAQVLILI